MQVLYTLSTTPTLHVQQMLGWRARLYILESINHLIKEGEKGGGEIRGDKEKEEEKEETNRVRTFN